MQILSFVDFENAYWAWHPERKEHEAGLTLFKRVIRCTQETNFHLAVSADNRFNFYLDGNLLGRGPLKSCLEHYYYDEYEGFIQFENGVGMISKFEREIKDYLENLSD